jgi:release factor glutamine methyltransferase
LKVSENVATIKELIDRMLAAAEPVYGLREALAVARLVAERRWGLSRADIALNPGATVDPGDDFDTLLADLAAARPVQYILGVADFDGIELAVGEGVLIPRPETEELVRWIADDVDGAAEILDIGTGSGAIALALARRLPQSHVTAIDISPEALHFARINKERARARGELAPVDLLQADILDPEARVPEHGRGGRQFSIIVSNPPYIPASERSAMASNVTEWEPARALFVPDDDSLVFYRTIAKFAGRNLAPGGALYFEIHEEAAQAMREMLEREGFSSIEVRNDINCKPRMVKCRI